MASYHLSVKSVRRSEGRSATAAIAYRTASRVVCEREGRVHDYRAKAGVEASFIVVADNAPEWARDRQALWNAAEARETRVNSVTAREWELALPAELNAQGRRLLVQGFAAELVARYGVAADVAIHAPHREGDQRNWHAHVLTTTRVLGRDSFGEKTRVLDAKQTGGAEVELMRERWAVMQNHALEQHGHEVRVDHRSLAVQRDAALAHGDAIRAETLDRPAEVKLGPVVSAIERREQREAEAEGRTYAPVTERGALVHEARAARGLLAELARVREALARDMQERVGLARETYAAAREEGADKVWAGLAALWAAAQRHGAEREGDRDAIKRRLAHIMDRQAELDEARGLRAPGPGLGRDEVKERLGRILGREASGPTHARSEVKAYQAPPSELDPIRQRLRGVLAREHAAPVVGREDPLALVAKRLRDGAADAPSFPSAREARAFRDEMERRFDPGTLARLGRGEEAALAQVAGDRLAGLCLARAWLDSGGEPTRSQARMSLVYAISGAQIDAKRERLGHEEDGHSWGL